MDRWKAEMGRGREKRRVEESRSEKRKSQKKEDADARKGRKVAKHSVFPIICGSGGSKSRLAKAVGAEPSGQMRDEQLHAVARSTLFPNQNVQSTPDSEHFWKLWCRKSARRCGAKHIPKSKRTKHVSFGALLEVQNSREKKTHLVLRRQEAVATLAMPEGRLCCNVGGDRAFARSVWRPKKVHWRALAALRKHVNEGAAVYWEFLGKASGDPQM